MKTNKITVVPRLRFPEFQDGGDWSFNSLERLANVVRGGSPRPIDKYMTENKNGLNWLKIGDVDKESKYITTTQDKVICSALSKTRVVKPDDLIMSNSMSFGRPYILKIESCIHDGWIAITEIDKNIDTNFLYYLILSNSSQRYFLDNAAGGGIRNLNIKIIEGLKVPFCTLPEQQKIADCLSSLDDLINAENEQLDALQEYKAGLLQQLFPAEGETTPKRRFVEFKDDGDWEEVKLVDLAETSIGLVTTMTTSYVEKGIPLIRNSDIKPNAIRMTKLINLSKEFADKYENKKLLKNDIVTVHTGDIGVSAIVEQDLEGSLGFATLNTRVTSSNVSPEFVCWFFNSPEYKRFALSMATGDGRNNFNLRDFNKTILFIPDILEQQKIVDCISSLDNYIQAKANQIDTLKTHKQGLMQQLFPTQNM